jgi:predicted RNA binding protein YcfA (HicA-like mRNA interferase family)
MKANLRVVVLFHAGKILHPKVVKQVFKAIGIDEESNP